MAKDKTELKFDDADIREVISKCCDKPSGGTVSECASMLLLKSHKTGEREVAGNRVPVYQKKYFPEFDCGSFTGLHGQNAEVRGKKAYDARRTEILKQAVGAIKSYILKTYGEVVRDPKSDLPTGFKNGGLVFRHSATSLEPHLVLLSEANNPGENAGF